MRMINDKYFFYLKKKKQKVYLILTLFLTGCIFVVALLAGIMIALKKK